MKCRIFVCLLLIGAFLPTLSNAQTLVSNIEVGKNKARFSRFEPSGVNLANGFTHADLQEGKGNIRLVSRDSQAIVKPYVCAGVGVLTVHVPGSLPANVLTPVQPHTLHEGNAFMTFSYGMGV